MKKLSSFKQLDEVLKYLEKQTNPPKKSLGKIFEDVKQGLNLSENDVLLILNKLKKDGFVATENVNVSPTSYVSQPPNWVLHYIITFEGKLFLDYPGGYVKQAQQRDVESIRLDKLESDQRENQKNMERLNGWIAFGTVAAAVIGLALLLWQMYSYFHPTP